MQRITFNKIVIDLVREYAFQGDKHNERIKAINHVRLAKRVYLVFELLRLNRDKLTRCYERIFEISKII